MLDTNRDGGYDWVKSAIAKGRLASTNHDFVEFMVENVHRILHRAMVDASFSS